MHLPGCVHRQPTHGETIYQNAISSYLGSYVRHSRLGGAFLINSGQTAAAAAAPAWKEVPFFLRHFMAPGKEICPFPAAADLRAVAGLCYIQLARKLMLTGGLRQAISDSQEGASGTRFPR